MGCLLNHHYFISITSESLVGLYRAVTLLASACALGASCVTKIWLIVWAAGSRSSLVTVGLLARVMRRHCLTASAAS